MVTVKSNVEVGANWNKFFKKIEEKWNFTWLSETRLASWKTAIEEANMYTLDGIDIQFTSEWTWSDIVKENCKWCEQKD